MSFYISDLVGQNVLKGAKLVAGRAGSSNEIKWINLMEIPDTPNSVQPFELLVTTGFGLQDEEKNKDLIPTLSKRGVSGIAIQPYYIDEIPNYIIKTANELNFPVFYLPKELTFSEILHAVLEKVSSATNDRNQPCPDAVTFLKQAVSQDISVFSEKLCPCALSVQAVTQDSTFIESLYTVRSFLLAETKTCSFANLSSGGAVFFAVFESDEVKLNAMYKLGVVLTHLSERTGTGCYVGIEKIHSEKEIKKAYANACEAVSVLRTMKARRGVCNFENIAHLKMFKKLHRDDSSTVLDNRPLQELMNYDRKNNTQLVHTLRIYLACNCNITQTSKALYVHRHTLMKRLKRLEAVSDLNLADYYTRVYMSVSLIFHDYFAY